MGGGAKRRRDSFSNAGAVLQDFVIPKSNDLETLRCQPATSLGIAVFTSGMLTAIDLDHQLRFKAHEVDDVGADGGLAAETPAFDLSIAQQHPKASFGLGLVRTQAPYGSEHHDEIIPPSQ